ncbi:MAG: hypothetical protein MHM6MM_004763 [Cercozoa sp. M6MM]
MPVVCSREQWQLACSKLSSKQLESDRLASAKREAREQRLKAREFALQKLQQEENQCQQLQRDWEHSRDKRSNEAAAALQESLAHCGRAHRHAFDLQLRQRDMARCSRDIIATCHANLQRDAIEAQVALREKQRATQSDTERVRQRREAARKQAQRAVEEERQRATERRKSEQEFPSEQNVVTVAKEELARQQRELQDRKDRPGVYFAHLGEYSPMEPPRPIVLQQARPQQFQQSRSRQILLESDLRIAQRTLQSVRQEMRGKRAQQRQKKERAATSTQHKFEQLQQQDRKHKVASIERAARRRLRKSLWLRAKRGSRNKHSKTQQCVQLQLNSKRRPVVKLQVATRRKEQHDAQTTQKLVAAHKSPRRPASDEKNTVVHATRDMSVQTVAEIAVQTEDFPLAVSVGTESKQPPEPSEKHQPITTATTDHEQSSKQCTKDNLKAERVESKRAAKTVPKGRVPSPVRKRQRRKSSHSRRLEIVVDSDSSDSERTSALSDSSEIDQDVDFVGANRRSLARIDRKFASLKREWKRDWQRQRRRLARQARKQHSRESDDELRTALAADSETESESHFRSVLSGGQHSDSQLTQPKVSTRDPSATASVVGGDSDTSDSECDLADFDSAINYFRNARANLRKNRELLLGVDSGRSESTRPTETLTRRTKRDKPADESEGTGVLESDSNQLQVKATSQPSEFSQLDQEIKVNAARRTSFTTQDLQQINEEFERKMDAMWQLVQSGRTESHGQMPPRSSGNVPVRRRNKPAVTFVDDTVETMSVCSEAPSVRSSSVPLESTTDTSHDVALQTRLNGIQDSSMHNFSYMCTAEATKSEALSRAAFKIKASRSAASGPKRSSLSRRYDDAIDLTPSDAAFSTGAGNNASLAPEKLLSPRQRAAEYSRRHRERIGLLHT